MLFKLYNFLFRILSDINSRNRLLLFAFWYQTDRPIIKRNYAIACCPYQYSEMKAGNRKAIRKLNEAGQVFYPGLSVCFHYSLRQSGIAYLKSHFWSHRWDHVGLFDLPMGNWFQMIVLRFSWDYRKWRSRHVGLFLAGKTSFPLRQIGNTLLFFTSCVSGQGYKNGPVHLSVWRVLCLVHGKYPSKAYCIRTWQMIMAWLYDGPDVTFFLYI